MEARIQLINQLEEQMTALKEQKDSLIEECHQIRIHDAIVAYLNTKRRLPRNIEEYIETQANFILAKWKGVRYSSIDKINPLAEDNEDYYHNLLELGTIFNDY
jgi:HD-like signal output (HDOD) protein